MSPFQGAYGRKTTTITGGDRGCPRSPAGRGAEDAYAGVRFPERALRVATDRHGIDRQPTTTPNHD